MRGVLTRKPFKAVHTNEAGVTLLETVIALALLGPIAVAFLSGLFITSRATIIADEQTTAASLARSQMEYVKGLEYVYDATEYATAPIRGGEEYIDYSAMIAAEPLHDTDDGIQKITVVISHMGRQVKTLEGFKVSR